MKVKKGDTVHVIKGKDRGKSGKVLHIDLGRGRLTVEKLNLAKKHVRPRRQGEKGELVEVPRPMAVANVMLSCPHCGRGVRVGYRVESGRKVRVCRRCKAAL